VAKNGQIRQSRRVFEKLAKIMEESWQQMISINSLN